jgi:aspartyl-tRNA(Asn)/glutamyl-tRNA(Gln) amidotransferase subunit C
VTTEHALSAEDVAHVAKLARLALEPDELERYTGQLAQILAHAQDIAVLDLDSVEPTSHPLPVVNVLRPDEPRPGLDRDEVLRAAPSVEDNRFRVPKIAAGPSGASAGEPQ